MEQKGSLSAASFVRNICILAHVDHGKTSLSDRLLAVNNLISEASAGKVRFLDSRQDEQTRQITIKASVVSLIYRRKTTLGAPGAPAGAPEAPETSETGEAPEPPGTPETPGAAEGDCGKKEAEGGTEAVGSGGPPGAAATPEKGQAQAAPPGGPSEGPPGDGGLRSPYFVNLIDCPGHVDFASEVSSAVRLCDGCLLLVDVVEGVCPQTAAALQQALRECLVPLLILTKVDRLISTLKASTHEAYSRIQAIIEQVNVLLHQQISEALVAWGSFSQGPTPQAASEVTSSNAALSSPGKSSEGPLGPLGPFGDPSGEFLYFDEGCANKLEFCPSKGNVLLASSLHGWCLSLPAFARQNLLRQLSLPPAALPKLCKALWGDFYLRRRRTKGAPPPNAASQGAPNQSEFEVKATPFRDGQPRMVEQFVLEPIWQLYAAAAGGGPSGGPPGAPQGDERLQRLSKIAYALGLKETEQIVSDLKRILSPARQRRGGDSQRQGEELAGELVTALMTRWMPMGEILLESLICFIPNPLAAARQRMRQLCPSLEAAFIQGAPLRTSLGMGPPVGAQAEPLLLLYVAKFLAADTKNLRLTGDSLHGGEELRDFVGLARVFSGRVSRGQKLFVCSEQHGRGPLAPSCMEGPLRVEGRLGVEGPPSLHAFVVAEVYLLFGQDLRPIGEASAGSVVALSLTPAADMLTDVSAWLERWKRGMRPAESAAAWGLRDETEREGRQPAGIVSFMRSLTLSNDPHCPPLATPHSKASSAIVRVAVEPEHLRDSAQFMRGIARLFLADPSIELSVLESGELLLGCCGEVHLETSLKDLETLFGGVPIRASPPMIAIRETLAFPSEEEGAPGAPGGPPLSLCRRVAFPPWAPKGSNVLSEDESRWGPLPGAPETASVAAAAATEDPFAAWIRRHRSSNSVVFGGAPDSLLTIVLRAQRMPDAVTDWLTENTPEVLSLFTSRAPSPRFLSPQEFLGTPGGLQGAPCKDQQALLAKCFSGLEAEFSKVWREGVSINPKGRQRGGGAPAGGAPTGPPGRLWGLALSGGACSALVASHNLTVLCPSGAPLPDSEVSGAPQGPLAEGSTAEGEGDAAAAAAATAVAAPPGWVSVARAKEETLAAAQNVSGASATPLQRFLPALLSGFERGALNGPLAEEPIRGVAFVVEVIVLGETILRAAQRTGNNPAGPAAAAAATAAAARAAATTTGATAAATGAAAEAANEVKGGKATPQQTASGQPQLVSWAGQVISSVKEACRAAMLQRGLCRIYEAMLRFTLSCDSKVIGRAYAVLAKRRAKILHEEIPEGQTSLFLVTGWLPTAEAVGISREIRSKASGHAALQLQFSHWEVLQEDPFPEACMTEEEVEDEGEVALAALATQITSRSIINGIRKSKGLPTEEKVVAAAEKQRTLSRNK